jgi:acetophenone carboxylase
MGKVIITEYLSVDLDLELEQWICRRCGRALGDARDNYKKGCLLYERDPREIHHPIIQKKSEYDYSPDPKWCRIIEFYCPGCGTMIENEYLPPGHPITHDIEIDIDALKKRAKQGLAVLEEEIGEPGGEGR